jgi:hypothetical protein
VRTVRHFFPDFNTWLDALPDGRRQDLVEYDKRFLCWWGLSLFLCKLGTATWSSLLRQVAQAAGASSTTR